MLVRLLTICLLITLPAPAGAILGANDAAPVLTAPAVDHAEAPFKRFSRVAPNLYRGAQPDDEGFEFLRTLGIRTVISLRNDSAERELVESLGMRFVHIPITFRPFSTDVPDAAVAHFFAAIDDPLSGPVFFHCKRGADRTGTFAALYRISRQGWSLDRAYDEARQIGMRWWYLPVKGELKSITRTLLVPAAAQ